MFSNILVGVDGRQGGRDAISLAKRLAYPGTRITLAHVDPTDQANSRADSKRMLRDASASAGIDARLLVVNGSSPARALHQLAARRHYDLLVVGTCHRGSLGRRFGHDHTIETLDAAACAVAVAPSDYSPPARLSRIGVGHDGSPESRQALAAARKIAARTGARIDPLLVLPVQSIPFGQPIQHRWSDVARQMTAQDLARLDGLDELDAQVSYGSPGEELACFSEEVDLLIIGSRSCGAVGRLFTGSTSNYLVRRTRCPLLVFPRRAAEAAVEPRDEQDLAAAAGGRG